MPTTSKLIAVTLAAATLVAIAGCATAASPPADRPAVPVALTRPGTGNTAPQASNRLPRQLPGLGPNTLAQVPANANQVIIVTGADLNSPDSTVVLYQRTPAG